MATSHARSDTEEVRIGTRGSVLALAQAHLVVEALSRAGRPSRVEVIETEGDRRTPDTAWAEGAFVTAIEQALLEGRVDIAVHSAKDMPTAEDRRLRIGAFLARADPRDVLVVPPGSPTRSLEGLPAGSRIGTDSPRRSAFLRAFRRDLVTHPLHGNVDTRLRRLEAGASDALVLAAAGLERLGLSDRIAQRLPPEVVPPAPGQGAIALQVRRDDDGLLETLAAIDDEWTRLAVEAERAFLACSGGGCRAPIGALATIEGDELVLRGAYALPDGSAAAFDGLRGDARDGPLLARELAGILGTRVPGVADRAPGSTHAGGVTGRRHEPWPRVLVTRAAEQAQDLVQELHGVGLDTVTVPTISIDPEVDGAALDACLRRLAGTDWIVITSANGAQAVLRSLARTGAEPGATRWCAVGTSTRATLEDHGIRVDLVPARSSGPGIGAQLPVSPGDRVLLVRGDLAGDDLPQMLRRRGAQVEDVIAYRTIEAPGTSRTLLGAALAGGRIDAVLFTSGSTVRGLVKLAQELGQDEAVSQVTGIPAICIGPETAREARRAGFLVLGQSPMQDAASLARAAARIISQPREVSP